MSWKSHPRAVMATVILCLVCPVLIQSGEAGDDFIVVNEPGGPGFVQQKPVLVETGSGALLGFLDGRSGAPELRIKVIDVDGGTSSPSIPLGPHEFPLRASELVLGANLSGHCVALWKVSGIQGRKVVGLDPSSGERIGEATRILYDELDAGFISEVTLEVMPDGTNLVFFMSDSSFKARIYSQDFQPLGPSFLIQDNTGGNYVDTAFHDNGTFTLAWTGVNKPYFSTVRARRFNADGTPLGPSHDLTTDADEVFIDTPAIAGRPDGRAMVSWLKNDIVPVILGQLLDVDGLPVGEPQTLVSGDSIFGDPRHLYPKSDGSWALVQQHEEDDWAASVRIFDEELIATDTVLTINDTLRNQAVWLAETEDIFMVWESPVDHPRKDIHGTLLSTSKGSIGDEVILSDDANGADQIEPVLSGNDAGHLAVAWLDRRSGETELFCQLYDEQNEPIGSNFRVVGASPVPGGHLGVEINASGDVVVSWVELSDDRLDLRARRFASDSSPVGDIMDITANAEEAPFEDCHVDILDDGRVLASWNHFEFMLSNGSIELDLYLRLYTDSGEPLTETGVRVDIDSNETRAHRPLDASVASDGSVRLHYWYGRPNSEHAGSYLSTVTDRGIGSDGMPMGSELIKFTVPYRFDQLSLSARQDRYTVAWTSVFNNSINCQFGITGSSVVRLDRILGEGQLGNPSVVRTSSGFCFVTYSESHWVDGVHVSKIKARRYDAFSIPVGDSFELFQFEDGSTFDSPGPFPVTAIAGNQIAGTFQGRSRTDQGLDIFMSTSDFEPCSASDFNCDGQVDSYDLSRLLGFWGLPETDLNSDATTNGRDLMILLGHWTG
jgi:hypothetical protein